MQKLCCDLTGHHTCISRPFHPLLEEPLLLGIDVFEFRGQPFGLTPLEPSVGRVTGRAKCRQPSVQCSAVTHSPAICCPFCEDFFPDAGPLAAMTLHTHHPHHAGTILKARDIGHAYGGVGGRGLVVLAEAGMNLKFQTRSCIRGWRESRGGRGGVPYLSLIRSAMRRSLSNSQSCEPVCN